MQKSEVYVGAALLGFLAGMRSMAAPAALGQLSRTGALAGVTGPLTLVTGRGFATTANLLAIAEMVADKLPLTPNRTAAGPLLGRAVAGGIGGAVLCSAHKRSVIAGGLVGAAAAVGTAYGAFQLRKRAGRNLGVPDGFIALAEDAAVGAIAITLTSRLRRSLPPK